MVKQLLFLSLVLLTSRLALAQFNLAGRVTNTDNQPVKGALVTVKGRGAGTSTDARGRFSLRTTDPLPLIVQIQLNGYRQRSVLVRGNNFRSIDVKLAQEAGPTDDMTVSVNRVAEDNQKVAFTVEKLGGQQLANTPALSPFDALQYVKGVDLLTQSILYKSVNVRGFGATDNPRLVQLTDGMDNRSPALGYGFGTVAGLPDLDVESLELVPGAASALYGPDALQGLLLTNSKNPFTYQGLSAQVKIGANNVGKPGFGPTGYYSLALRYARQIGDRLAVKVNVQRVNGTDFLADDDSDRSTRARDGFFSTDPSRGGVATGIGYVPNNDPNTNFTYDAVNRYGDDLNAGGAYRFPPAYSNGLLQNRLVTRTGYTELDVLGTGGRVLNDRADAALHYKLGRDLEASVDWYYGRGNFTRTTAFHDYFPDFQRHQFRAELRSSSFFVRAYATRQQGEGWSLGQTATAINEQWKPLNQWASEFGQAYVDGGKNGGISLARSVADRGRLLPGTDAFNQVRDQFTQTDNTDLIPGSATVRGTRFRDNSALYHYEGMYDASELLDDAVELMVGGSIRQYRLNTGGTLVALKPDGGEYAFREYGAYAQVAKEIALSPTVLLKPTVAARYDKNDFFAGGFTPRASMVVSLGPHNVRGSWQTAFRNPSPEQLLAVPVPGRGGSVGGSPTVAASAGLTTNPAYLDTDVMAYAAGRLTESQLRARPYLPVGLTTERIQTWEVGYKTLIQHKLYVDAVYFHSRYANLVTARPAYQANTGRVADLLNGAYRTLLINANSTNDLFVDGWGLSAEYGLGSGFMLGGNYTHQIGTVTVRDAQGNVVKDNAGVDIVRRRMSNPEVAQQGRTSFQSPDKRYNLSLSNARITDRLGATLNYRWTDRVWVEQGITAGDTWLPAWSTVDAQVSYRLPVAKSVVRLGGTNLLNQYYAQGYGLPRIGGVYYVSLTFDELMR